MFSFNYKIIPVNEAKNIYKLTPTLGTYAKAFAPTLFFGAVVLLAGVYASYEDNKQLNDLEFTPSDLEV